MLTMLQPMADAEFNDKLRFSCNQNFVNAKLRFVNAMLRTLLILS